jgi:hypothetical protein
MNGSERSLNVINFVDLYECNFDLLLSFFKYLDFAAFRSFLSPPPHPPPLSSLNSFCILVMRKIRSWFRLHVCLFQSHNYHLMQFVCFPSFCLCFTTVNSTAIIDQGRMCSYAVPISFDFSSTPYWQTLYRS